MPARLWTCRIPCGRGGWTANRLEFDAAAAVWVAKVIDWGVAA
jgi:hypothetical protein